MRPVLDEGNLFVSMTEKLEGRDKKEKKPN